LTKLVTKCKVDEMANQLFCLVILLLLLGILKQKKRQTERRKGRFEKNEKPTEKYKERYEIIRTRKIRDKMCHFTQQLQLPISATSPHLCMLNMWNFTQHKG